MKPSIILFFIFVIGFGLFAYSFTLPYYSDLGKKSQLDSDAAEAIGKDNFAKFKSRYYTEIGKLETNKRLLMDLGSGLVICATIIWLFLLISKIRRFSDFFNLYSLNKRKLFVIANVGWLVLIPGTIWYYFFRASRDDYPWFADSLGIPLSETIPVIFLGLIPLNIFLFLTSIGSIFPAKLFIRPVKYNMVNIAWEVFWLFFFLITTFFFIDLIIDGDHISIIVDLFFFYVLLALRAGKIDKGNHSVRDIPVQQ